MAPEAESNAQPEPADRNVAAAAEPISSPRWFLLLFAAFALGGLGVLLNALSGPFISDDFLYIHRNPYVQSLSLENLVAILDPTGPARFVTGNYAPVHMLVLAGQWGLFGRDVLGYHVFNIALHALNCALFVSLLLSSGVSRRWALLGGAFFAFHPANVEAVAWIFQSKTTLALSFSLAALLAHRSRPALGTTLFALAMLTKSAAIFALPMAAALTWARRGEVGGGTRHWIWIAGWVLIFALCTAAQIDSVLQVGLAPVPGHADGWIHLRTIAAIGTRYLVMAASSYGVSAFHEPSPVTSPLDPWWLAALPATALLAWRTVATLRARSEEAAYWIGAAAAFAPVSQVIPFYFAMADRYLYFILPGLIGGALLWGRELRPRVEAALAARKLAPRVREGLDDAARIAFVALILFFALQAAGRAGLWQREILLLVDSAENYPEGGTAHYVRAVRAIGEGEADQAMVELRRAVDRRSYHMVRPFHIDPWLAPLRKTPAFRNLVHDIAGMQIEYARERGFSTQLQLRGVAGAHFVRGEYGEAERVLERAIERGGPLTPALIEDLTTVRAKRAGQPQGEEDPGR